MSRAIRPPKDDEFELTLLGPSYGESIVMHVGAGEWVIVDSFLAADGQPAAVRYLEEINIDPAEAVVLIVATHWHDDHIRGITRLVELCPTAEFCCASALCREEFLARVEELEGRHFSASGSGLREIHNVFTRLAATGKVPMHALANRVVLRTKACTISSLSPGDGVFQRFLASVGRLIPNQGKAKIRIRGPSPNEVAVVLWVDVHPFSLLLGADLERKGWLAILKDKARPVGRASVFKIPHHGSRNADVPGVWKQLLKPDPYAVLTPWHRGGHVLPTPRDTKRIMAATANAYVSAANTRSPRRGINHTKRAVARTLRESGARFRSLTPRGSAVQLRRSLASATPWSVELIGNACHLKKFAA